MNAAHLRTLQKALEIVETKERLAAALDLPMEELEAYLAGAKPLPTRLFIDALDIVASKPR